MMRRFHIISASFIISFLLAFNFTYAIAEDTFSNMSYQELLEFKEYINEKLDAEIAKRREEMAADGGEWVQQFFVDRYEQPTDKMYMTTKELINGEFSNSASKNAKLEVKILIQKQNVIEFMFYEYGVYTPSYVADYWVYVKDSDGNEISFKGYGLDDRVKVIKDDAKKLIDLMMKEETITISIEDKTYYRDKYLFTIDPIGFKSAFEELK